MPVLIDSAKQEYGTIVTKYGEIAAANAWALGQKVELIRFAVGDGLGSYYIPSPDMTQLKNEVWSGPISDVEPDEKEPNEYKVYTVLPAQIGGFIIRETALFDKNNNMIAICNFPELKKVAIESGAIGEFKIFMSVLFVHAGAIKFVIDPTVSILTKEDLNKHNQIPSAHVPAFNRHNEDPHAHDNRFEPLEPYYELVRIDHGLNCYPKVMVGTLQWGGGMGGAGEHPAGGSDMSEVAVRVVWHSRQSLTVYTAKTAARAETVKTLHRCSGYQYTVTFQGNEADSVYIELIAGQHVPVLCPSSVNVSPNMGLEILEG